jgi:hypothetical protein
MMNNDGDDLDEVEAFKESLPDKNTGDLVELLIDVKMKDASLDEDDLTKQSKINIKIREIKREIDNRFIERGAKSDDDSESSSKHVSKVSDLF